MNKNKQPIAIVLGGTNPHIALIKNLKNRDYYTILVDYLENPPAKEIADKHIQASTLDQEEVLSIARNEKADLVISTCIDQANVTACYVGEKLGLPIPYSHQCALEISNKTTLKELMRKGNIPTANFISLHHNNQDHNNTEVNLNDLRFPLVVKPSDCNGSKGVRRANTDCELEKYLAEALKVSRNKKAIIEEFEEGYEVSIDCFVIDYYAHILSMNQKRKPDTNDDSVIFSIGSISPAKVSATVKRKIQDIANRIAHVFGLNNTPLLIQVIINDDHVKVVEFAPRIGGGLNFKKIKLFAKFDIIDAAVNSFLGVFVKPDFVQPDVLYSENHIYTEPGVFGEITGYHALLDEQVVVAFYPNKTKGMTIQPDKASKDRAASFIVQARSMDEMIDKVTKTLLSVKVLDINGNELSFLENYKNLLLQPA